MSQDKLRSAIEESNKIMQYVSKLINDSNLDLRVSVILLQAGIDYFINHTNELQFGTDKFEVVRMDTKLSALEDVGLITSDLKFNLLQIAKIRHLFAHKIKIEENTILNLLKTIKNNETDLDSKALDIRNKYILTIANSSSEIKTIHDGLLCKKIQ